MSGLLPGSRIGPYEVVSAIGAGGMGEVYRARDSRLDRDVALKILPDAFASDPDRLMRFEREAKMLAALNHPRIAQIHGLEVASGEGTTQRALVMELVEGDDLSIRIAQGPIPLTEALAIARQIAEALEAAHAQGVIHRDLKPANIKVRPDDTVKVLDFGLAKALASDSNIGSAPLISSPTITSPAMTARGVVLGTSAYMSPEQARGKAVDQRADIWAFGCVLYEMLTGRRAFPGDDVTDVLAKVIEREPDWSVLPATTPPLVQSLLKRCLRKDPVKRLHHIADARLDLDDAMQAPVPADRPESRSRRTPVWMPLAAALVTGVIGIGGTALWLRPAPAAPEPKLRLELPLGSADGSATMLVSLSPDGRWLAYRSTKEDGQLAIRLRDLSSDQEREVSTQAAGFAQAIWSPSGNRLILQGGGRLRLIEVSSLATREIQLGPALAGLSWIDEDQIIVSLNGRMHRMRIDGGTPAPLPAEDGDGDDRRLPGMLPDGQRYLFVRGLAADREVRLGSLDAPGSTVVTKVFRYAYARGRAILLMGADGRLRSQRFDPDAGTLIGEPVELASMLAPAVLGVPAATISQNGLIAFVASSAASSSGLDWYARDGKRLSQAVGPGPGSGLDTSLDARLGVTSVNIGASPGVFVLDLVRGLRSRLTTEPSGDVVISPDGRFVAYVVDRQRIDVQPALGGEARTVFSVGQGLSLEHWSADGKYLVAMKSSGPTREVIRIAVDGKEPQLTLASNLPLIDEMRLSPDGRWMAFNAAFGDRNEVYLSPVPPTGERLQISTAGGTSARWRDDGRELYYLAPDGTLMATAIATRDGRPDPSVPAPLFKTRIVPTYNLDHYAVGPGGRTFLLRLPVNANELTTATLLVNWFQ